MLTSPQATSLLKCDMMSTRKDTMPTRCVTYSLLIISSKSWRSLVFFVITDSVFILVVLDV